MLYFWNMLKRKNVGKFLSKIALSSCCVLWFPNTIDFPKGDQYKAIVIFAIKQFDEISLQNEMSETFFHEQIWSASLVENKTATTSALCTLNLICHIGLLSHSYNCL